MAPTTRQVFALLKRDSSVGSRAGTIVGVIVAAILLALIVVFFIIHLRRRSHNAALDRERAILAGEKHQDGTDKAQKPFDNGGMPRRNKSVKDRLMGPLYRQSAYDMPAVPAKAKQGVPKEIGDGDLEFLNKPWTKENNHRASAAPSFSSRRATRMMMMM